MRITLLAAGSRGDVQPFIALAYHLQQAGFTVQIVANSDFEPLARAYGIAYISLGPSTQALLETPEGQKMLHSGNLFAGIAFYRQQVRRQMDAAQQIAWAAAQQADILIYSGLLLWGGSIAEKLQIPAYPVFLVPLYPTRAIPVAQSGIPDIPFLNPLFYHVVLQTTWLVFRSSVNTFRRKTLQIAPLPIHYQPIFQHLSRVCFAYSPTIWPAPADWPAQAQVTGYCFLPPPPDWQPPASLQAFLASGPPPIYFGFGSMVDRQAEQKTRIVLEAIMRSGQRAILQRGWGGLTATELPAEICMVDSLPHEWLFERVSLVVHHGGAGTTAAGVRAGIPNLIVPHFADQYFWGARMAQMGVAPRPIPLKELTAERLAHAIRQALTDETLRSNAARLGQQIRAEDGVGTLRRVLGL